jgi:hypothetical protein
VLVLNSTYEPVNVCSARRAVVLLLKGKAEVVDAGAVTMHSERASFIIPAVIKLLHYVRVPWADRRRLSRRGGMTPSRRPRPPQPSDFVLASQRVVPEAWMLYLETSTA